jgi:hypothetical protein
MQSLQVKANLYKELSRLTKAPFERNESVDDEWLRQLEKRRWRYRPTLSDEGKEQSKGSLSQLIQVESDFIVNITGLARRKKVDRKKTRSALTVHDETHGLEVL